MSELRKQLRAYFGAKALPADKVEAILARARAAAGGRAAREVNAAETPVEQRSGRWLALAAAVLALAGLGAWWQRETQRVPYAAVPPRLMECFAHEPQLDPAPQDKSELQALMVGRSAPAGFRIPASLAPLESAACQVLAVQDRSVYLMCFWRVAGAKRGVPELVHLLVSRRADFRAAPRTAEPELQSQGGWSFASWQEGEILYTLAAAAPLETLRPFLAADFHPRPWSLGKSSAEPLEHRGLLAAVPSAP